MRLRVSNSGNHRAVLPGSGVTVVRRTPDAVPRSSCRPVPKTATLGRHRQRDTSATRGDWTRAHASRD
jgi:hypothetical protein